MVKVGFFIIGKPVDSKMEDIIFSDMRDILTNEDFTNIAFCENEESHDILYTFLSESKNYQLLELFNSYEVLIHFSDITNEVLIQNGLTKVLTDGEFKPLLDEFLMKNLKIDFILEKINKLGIESLTKMDYKVLKS